MVDDCVKTMAKTPPRLKICFLSVATHLGGGERSLLDLVTHLNKNGESEVLVIFPKCDGPFIEECKKRQIPYRICEMPETFSLITRDKPFFSLIWFLFSAPKLFWYLLRLKSHLVEENPSILHTNGIKSHLIGSILSLWKGFPLVWHGRDIFQGFTLFLLKFFSRFTKPWIIFNSKAAANAFGVPARAQVIYNGIEYSNDARANTTTKGSPMPEFQQVLQKKFYFGILGVLARWKGQDLFLDLAESLKNEDCGFVIMGSRIYDTASDLDFEQELKDKAKGLPVFFTGKVDQPFDYLRKIDCLVHCSRKPEPFGRVIVEAQLMGIPVIAAAAGGVLEIIEDGKNGLLYPPNDLSILTTKAKAVLQSEQLRKTLSAEGKSSAMARFSISSHTQQVLALYRQVLENSIR